uniref:Superoxide dismutase n=1 Tax=Gossypium raimondii TaxID=29730 RepID=A0A0D2VBL8_GOSRA|nr:hypothetical protein B456_013G068400 [Gossypium raimondii]
MACQLLLTDFTLPLKSLKLSHSGQRLKGRSIGSQKASTTVAYYGLKTPPYNLDDLEPYMSKRALEVHWGVHHRDFVDNLNKQLGKSDILYGYTMDELVKATYNNGNPLPEFNNAAEVWNHDFFWESMQPGGGDMPNLGLLEQIENDFGSFTNFRETFVEAALSLFGSGWVWLVSCLLFGLQERQSEIHKHIYEPPCVLECCNDTHGTSRGICEFRRA